MADDEVGQVDGQTTDAQESSTAPAAGTSEGFHVPDGQMLVDVTEHKRLTDIATTHKGLAPIGHKAIELGWRDPESLVSAHEALSTLQKNGIDPSNISRLFERGGGDTAPEPDEQFKDLSDRFSKLEVNQRRTEALGPHQRASLDGDQIADKALGGLLDDDSSPRDRVLFKSRFNELVGSELYPQDHPLRDEALVPVTQERADKAIKQMREELGLEAAREILDTGRAVNMTKPTAGGRAGQGGANKDAKKAVDPLDMDEDDAQQAGLDALKKFRSKSGHGGTVGSLQN